jgi:hypothetical protein
LHGEFFAELSEISETRIRLKVDQDQINLVLYNQPRVARVSGCGKNGKKCQGFPRYRL